MDQNVPSVLPPCATKEWIAGRVEVLLSHYFQPDNPVDVQDAAIADWIRALDGFSQQAISRACDSYIRDQPRRRPSPGDILARARNAPKPSAAPDLRRKKSDLSRDELELLAMKVIPTARRWLQVPGLADSGRQTLEYWNEPC